MDELLAKRARAAAVAGWWTVLVAVVWLLVAWLVSLALMHGRPSWLLDLWGGGKLTWADVQKIILWLFGAFKMALWFVVLVVVWLTLWARQLRRTGR